MKASTPILWALAMAIVAATPVRAEHDSSSDSDPDSDGGAFGSSSYTGPAQERVVREAEAPIALGIARPGGGSGAGSAKPLPAGSRIEDGFFYPAWAWPAGAEKPLFPAAGVPVSVAK